MRGWAQAGRCRLSGRPSAFGAARANFPPRRRPLPAPRSAPGPRPAAPPPPVPLLPPPLLLPEDESGLYISELPRGEGKRKERRTDGKKKGAGVGGLLQQNAQPERWEAAEPSVRASPAALLLCALSLVYPLPSPSPFNLRQPYRQLTHIVSILLTYSYSQGQDPGCCRSAPPIVLQQHAHSPAAPISGELSL